MNDHPKPTDAELACSPAAPRIVEPGPSEDRSVDDDDDGEAIELPIEENDFDAQPR